MGRGELEESRGVIGWSGIGDGKLLMCVGSVYLGDSFLSIV